MCLSLNIHLRRRYHRPGFGIDIAARLCSAGKFGGMGRKAYSAIADYVLHPAVSATATTTERSLPAKDSNSPSHVHVHNT